MVFKDKLPSVADSQLEVCCVLESFIEREIIRFAISKPSLGAVIKASVIKCVS